MKTILTNQKKKIALIFILVIGVLGFILTPDQQKAVSSFTLDINPSIKISLDQKDDVVAVDAINSDAQKVLAGYKLNDRDLEDVIDEIVNRLILNGYLRADSNENALLVSGANEGVNKIIDLTLADKQIKGNIYTQDDVDDKDLAKKAKQYRISTGKMSIIEKIVSSAPVTYDELAQLSVKDIIDYAKTNNISLEFLDDQIDIIEDNLNKEIDHLDVDDIDDIDDDHDDIDDIDDDHDDIDDIDDDHDDIDDIDDDHDDFDDIDDDHDDFDDIDDDQDDIDDIDDDQDDDDDDDDDDQDDD